MTIFSCRVCSESPLSIWERIWTGDKENQKPEEKKKTPRISRRTVSEFQRRSPEELKACIASWERYAHPRAREFFPTKEMLETVLDHLARGIHREDDPVLGDDTKCVYWYGDVTIDDKQAAIKMVKPGEAHASISYVNRVLAFIFATDESFDHLMRLPKQPFKMSCGDQLCVNLAHISLQVDDRCREVTTKS